VARAGLVSKTVKIFAKETTTGITGSVSVTVKVPVLQKIKITPENPLIEVGIAGGQFMTATGEFSAGKPQDVTEMVKWSSSPTKVVNMGRNIAVGSAPGTATITAEFTPPGGGTKVIGTTTATVHAAGKAPALKSLKIDPVDPATLAPLTRFGQQQRFKATGTFDGNSHEVTDKVTWTSTDPDALDVVGGVATVADAANKSVTITAEDPKTKKKATISVTVNVPAVQSLQIVLQKPTLSMSVVNDTAEIKVIAVLADGTKVPMTNKIVFTDNPPFIAAVAAGLVHPVNPGQTTIQAEYVTDPNVPPAQAQMTVTP
jgi:hypothetical protein